MDQERIAQALARIDAAARRIEAVAAQPSGPDPELARKYSQLRASVGDSLRELDVLIGTLAG
jgi:hypothetical protein